MKLSEKIQEALRQQQEINLSDPVVQKRLAAQWGYVPADAQPAPSFADAYQGAMEEVAIWKRRALEAEALNRKFIAELNGPMHIGEPAPSGEQDTSVRKAWARFSNELHRSPDAPYPGMADAFEQHFSQSFTDREWRSESATWAAAWKAAKRHEAQAQPAPSVPECPYPCGWRNLLKIAIEDGAYLARSINEDEPVTENARAVTMRMVMRLRDDRPRQRTAPLRPQDRPPCRRRARRDAGCGG
jgi:hypothetical protein